MTPMTTEQPDAALPIDRTAGTRRLRRRTTDRVIGGVAGGLGEYLNVDPVLFRALFAGLVIFGGAGLVLYVLGWLLIPEGGQEASIAEGAVKRMLGRPGWLVALLVILAGIMILRPWTYDSYFYVPPEIFLGFAIAFAGVLLMLLRDRPDGGGASPVAISAEPGAAAAGAAAAPASAWPRSAAIPRAPRERSPLGWYVLAGALAVVAALAVADTVGGVRVVPGQYFGAGLLALGLGLVVGAWWGRARLLILLGILVLPVAAVSAFLTVPLEGGIADDTFRPANVAELQPAYRIVGGRVRIDLTGLEAGSDPIDLTASVGAGDLYVVVPRGASVLVTGTVQGGHLYLLGRDHTGTGLVDRVSAAGWFGGPRLVLTLDVGIGSLWVERAQGGG